MDDRLEISRLEEKRWIEAGPGKNVELWMRLDKLMQRHQIEFEHVKGHSGHLENERCDELAVTAYQKYLKKS